MFAAGLKQGVVSNRKGVTEQQHCLTNNPRPYLDGLNQYIYAMNLHFYYLSD